MTRASRLWLSACVYFWRFRGPGPGMALCSMCLGLTAVGLSEGPTVTHSPGGHPVTPAPAASSAAPSTDRNEPEAFLQNLARRLSAIEVHDRNGVIERIHELDELAAQHGLTWPQGRYGQPLGPTTAKAGRHPAPGLWRIDIEQPLLARYSDLRRYLMQAHLNWPDMALQRMVLEPAPTGSGPRLSARLVWEMWWRDGRDSRWPEPDSAQGSSGRDLAWAQVADITGPVRDPFEWMPLPPSITPSTPDAPPPPTPPAWPWTYAGRQLSEGVWTVFLLGQDGAGSTHPLLVRAGDTLDGGWRVERIAPPDMELTYLPLSHTVRLPIGDQL